MGVQGGQNRVQNVKEVVRISLIVWYGFRDAFFTVWVRKWMRNRFNLWLKLLYEAIMCIFCESAYFIDPFDVSEGLGPPKMSENR